MTQEKPQAGDLVLHNYFRSSSAYRVRIALNLKGLPFDYRSVHLNRGGGEQFGAAFTAHNTQQLVPVLSSAEGDVAESLAIIEYLDETHPEVPLLGTTPFERARVRQLSLAMACNIHPLNNLRVLKYLKHELGHAQEDVDEWYVHWMSEGLPALEALAAPKAGKFLVGDSPTGADVCLVPQLYNARRFNVPLDQYPTLLRAEENANRIDAFAAAHPDRQEVPA